MRLRFRAKLLILVGAMGIVLMAVAAGSVLLGMRQAADLATIEGRLVPKLELGPQLDAQFTKLRQALQDAAAAQDRDALGSTRGMKDDLVARIRAASSVLNPGDADALVGAVDAYYDSAYDVSRRLVSGETGESLAASVTAMQQKQRTAAELLEKTTALNRNELTTSFTTIRDGSAAADRFRVGISVAGILLVLSITTWMGRDVLRNVTNMSSGFARFGAGNFSQPIPVTTRDELGDAAAEANQMAARLQALAADRDKGEWLDSGLAGLAREVRGELAAAEVAKRALAYLAPRIGAVVGALYLAEDEGYGLAGTYALRKKKAAQRKILLGEGLLGEAMAAKELRLVDGLPADYLPVESGLGKAAATQLAIVPIVHLDRVLGVVELGAVKPMHEHAKELLESVGETLAVALEVARSRGVLEGQNTALEEARLQLQEKAEQLGKVSTYKSQFLANMSHELRTPLNSMLLLSHLLAENEAGTLSPKQVEHASTIYSAGKDLLHLINQILDLAKIEAGKQVVHIEPVPIRTFAMHAERMFSTSAAQKGLTLQVRVEDGLPSHIATDELRLQQILTNLLGNAIKFTDRGTVTLRVFRAKPGTKLTRPELAPESTIGFSVRDTGIGIAPETQASVFAPFEQIEAKSTRRYGGTGLGLAIARESVLLLGGELVLQSELGQGSTFTCYLPERDLVLSDAPAPVERTSTLPVPDDRSDVEPGEPHLLVVEDDRIVAEQLVDIIHGRGLKVIVAGTGEEGLRLARQLRPRGVVLDVRLPDIDGWTVMARLRDAEVTNTIPVHFISAIDARDRGLALGAVGYLIKPASRRQLADAVRLLAPDIVQRAAKVLVVEDSADDAESVLRALRAEEIDSVHVGNAKDALEVLSNENLGCIILDLGLPDVDGLTLLTSIRERAGTEAPPIIVHTGRALTPEETARLGTFAEAVIPKGPTSSARLLEEVRLFVERVRETLPGRAAQPPRALPSDEVAPAPPVSRDEALRGRTILIADDDMRAVYALSAILRERGAEVLVADNGADAVETAKDNPALDAVLMDIMMPTMDGYEAMRRLRADERFGHLPIIALTANAMKGEEERCLQAGASKYLAKPIDVLRLLSTLKGLLAPRAA